MLMKLAALRYTHNKELLTVNHTQVFTFEQQIIVYPKLSTEVDKIAGVFSGKKRAFGCPLPASDLVLRDHLLEQAEMKQVYDIY